MKVEQAFDPAETVRAGFAVVADLARDPSLVVGGTAIYRTVARAVGPELRARDLATIAVPCVRMQGKLPAILVVLQDRAILAWRSGVYRKKFHVETKPLSESWGATIAPGIGARQPVKVLTVQWAEGPPWVVAVPSADAATRFLRACFIPAPGSR